ncbi:MAG: hypothetical protein ACI33S_07065 [Bacilli bacterium]
MKKKFIVLLTLFIIILITGCKNDNYALEFKEEYESLNGQINKYGNEYRSIVINEKNPYIKVTAKEIIKKIENKETFYLYVGDPLCPWCRSVLEKSIEVANKNNINKIYYIEIWDDDGNEILRDKYEFQDEQIVKTIQGTDEYKKLLKYFDSELSDYILTNSNSEKVLVGEKRIYAPSFFYIKDGSVRSMTDGISEIQKDSREELTKEILEDEENIFQNFFAPVCNINGC